MGATYKRRGVQIKKIKGQEYKIMEKIIDPVDLSLIKSELTFEKFLRKTNKANNEIYIFTAQEAPNTMREIGRLREIAFRDGGGGTGLDCDIDDCDTMENPYKQLIVWNPDAEEIIGGYRFIHGGDIELDDKGQPVLSTAHMFHFTEKFIKEYLPYMIELGRSFVRVEYQVAAAGAKGLFALDNLWDGLGAITITYPNTKHFFGKVTMYPDFGTYGRDMILCFLDKYFEDKDKMVTPFNGLKLEHPKSELEKILKGNDYKEDFKILNTAVRETGQNIPPMVNAYMSLSSTMKVFGTSLNDEFGNVEETGILVSIAEVNKEKRLRHIESFNKEESGLLQHLQKTSKAI